MIQSAFYIVLGNMTTDISLDKFTEWVDEEPKAVHPGIVFRDHIKDRTHVCAIILKKQENIDVLRKMLDEAEKMLAEGESDSGEGGRDG